MNCHRGRQDMLAAEIRRQIGAAQSTRYLRSLPLFEVPDDDNGRWRELLRQVDHAEARQSRRRD